MVRFILRNTLAERGNDASAPARQLVCGSSFPRTGSAPNSYAGESPRDCRHGRVAPLVAHACASEAANRLAADGSNGQPPCLWCSR